MCKRAKSMENPQTLSQLMLITDTHSVESGYKQVDFQRREFEVARELHRVGCVDYADASWKGVT